MNRKEFLVKPQLAMRPRWSLNNQDEQFETSSMLPENVLQISLVCHINRKGDVQSVRKDKHIERSNTAVS